MQLQHKCQVKKIISINNYICTRQFELKIQPAKYSLCINFLAFWSFRKYSLSDIPPFFPLYFFFPVYGGRESKNHIMSSKIMCSQFAH